MYGSIEYPATLCQIPWTKLYPRRLLYKLKLKIIKILYRSNWSLVENIFDRSSFTDNIYNKSGLGFCQPLQIQRGSLCALPAEKGYQVSCILYQVPCIQYQVPCILYQVPCIHYQVPCILYQVPWILYQVPCILY